MGIGGYYAKVFMTAFRHSWSIAETIMATLAALACFAWAFIPALNQIVGQRPDISNMWQAIALTFGAVFVFRLICAPYWMWQEQQAALSTARTAEELHDAREAAEQRRHDERMDSEARTRLHMDGKGWLARYTKNIRKPPEA